MRLRLTFTEYFAKFFRLNYFKILKTRYFARQRLFLDKEFGIKHRSFLQWISQLFWLNISGWIKITAALADNVQDKNIWNFYTGQFPFSVYRKPSFGMKLIWSERIQRASIGSFYKVIIKDQPVHYTTT